MPQGRPHWAWPPGDGADDRIVQLVHAHPHRATPLVYTSDAKLRTRLKALGIQVMGSRTLLKHVAKVSGTMEPTATGHTAGPADGVDGEVTPRNPRATDHMHRRRREPRTLLDECKRRYLAHMPPVVPSRTSQPAGRPHTVRTDHLPLIDEIALADPFPRGGLADARFCTTFRCRSGARERSRVECLCDASVAPAPERRGKWGKQTLRNAGDRSRLRRSAQSPLRNLVPSLP